MALFRCNSCSHIRVVSNNYIGKTVKCPQCKKANPIHDTVLFVESILNKYSLQQAKLSKYEEKKKDDKKTKPQTNDRYVELKNIGNTKALTKQEQYEPILKWFKAKEIIAEVNHNAVDTTGFFDEIALSLGNQFDILSEVSNKIKYIQKKGYINVKLPLENKNKNDIATIKKFCKELYEYSFITKYFFKKQEQVVYLTLQNAPEIINFFNGIWMEWYIFMKLLEFFKLNKISNSCLRSLKITYPNNDTNELDIFFIANGVPFCIECKSGEFRPYIEKYTKLRKRLKIKKENFILCIAGLEQKQTQGLTSTYDLTFANEKNFLQHVKSELSE